MAILQQTFSAFAKWMAAPRNSAVAEDSSLVVAKIEETVGAFDSRIRGLWRYRNRLTGPVEKALKHSYEIASQLPETVECSRRTLSEENALRAMFVNSQHLDEVLHRNSVLPDFFSNDGQAAECYALMCVNKTEKEFFGAAMVHDKVIGDVPQVRINFRDHRFKVTAASQEEAHKGSRDYFFQTIIGYAISKKAEIISERVKNNITISRLSLNESLDLLADILDRPENVLRINHSPVAVSRTGIKQDGMSADRNCLSFTLPEIQIGDFTSLKGLVPVSVPREEIRIRHRVQGLDFKAI